MRRRYHVLFFIVTFCFWFSSYVYVPIFSPFLSTMGATYVFTGFVLGSYGILQVILRFPLGFLADFIKIKVPFIWFGIATSIVSSIGIVFSDSLYWILFFRILSGVTAATWVIFTVIYAGYFEIGLSHKAMATMQSVMVVAQLISMGLSGMLVNNWGWHSPFWVGGCVGLVGLVLSFLLVENPKENKVKVRIERKDLKVILKDNLLWKSSILSIFAHSLQFITIFGFLPLQALHIGMKETEISVVVVCFLIPHAIAPILAVRYFNSMFGMWKTLSFAFAFTTIFTSLTAIVKNHLWFYLIQICNGFALGLTFSIFLGMAIQNINNRYRTTAMGFYQSVYAIGIVLGPYIAGVFSNIFSFQAVFYIGACFALLGTILSIQWGYKSYSKSLSLHR